MNGEMTRPLWPYGAWTTTCAGISENNKGIHKSEKRRENAIEFNTLMGNTGISLKKTFTGDNELESRKHYEDQKHTPINYVNNDHVNGLGTFLRHAFAKDLEVYETDKGQTVTKDVNTLMETAITNLKENNPLFRGCRLIKTGSIVEGTKIGEMNEFDFLLQLDIFEIKDLYNIPGGGTYALLKVTEQEVTDFISKRQKETKLSASHQNDSSLSLPGGTIVFANGTIYLSFEPPGFTKNNNKSSFLIEGSHSKCDINAEPANKEIETCTDRAEDLINVLNISKASECELADKIREPDGGISPAIDGPLPSKDSSFAYQVGLELLSHEDVNNGVDGKCSSGEDNIQDNESGCIEMAAKMEQDKICESVGKMKSLNGAWNDNDGADNNVYNESMNEIAEYPEDKKLYSSTILFENNDSDKTSKRLNNPSSEDNNLSNRSNRKVSKGELTDKIRESGGGISSTIKRSSQSKDSSSDKQAQLESFALENATNGGDGNSSPVADTFTGNQSWCSEIARKMEEDEMCESGAMLKSPTGARNDINGAENSVKNESIDKTAEYLDDKRVYSSEITFENNESDESSKKQNNSLAEDFEIKDVQKIITGLIVEEAQNILDTFNDGSLVYSNDCSSGVATTLHFRSKRYNMDVSVDLCLCISIAEEDIDNVFSASGPDKIKDNRYVNENKIYFNFIKSAMHSDPGLEVFAIIGTEEKSEESQTVLTRITVPRWETSPFIQHGPRSGQVNTYRYIKCIAERFFPKAVKRWCPSCSNCILKSYHLKTILLYMMDNHKEPSLWSEANIPNRVIEVFDIIVECLRSGLGDAYDCADIATFSMPGRLTINRFYNYYPCFYLREDSERTLFTGNSEICDVYLPSFWPEYNESMKTGYSYIDKVVKSHFDELQIEHWSSTNLILKVRDLLYKLREISE